jgi:hypothetical protein
MDAAVQVAAHLDDAFLELPAVRGGSGAKLEGHI